MGVQSVIAQNSAFKLGKFGMSVLFCLCILISACSHTDRIQQGEKIPEFSYRTAGNLEIPVRNGNTDPVLIVFFDTHCNCIRNIYYLENHSDDLASLNVYLLCTTPGFFKNNHYYAWTRLRHNPSVRFGQIETTEKTRLFGAGAPLDAWLFASDGRLVRHLGKEVRIGLVRRLGNGRETSKGKEQS